jgi:uncharacterized protein involved in propanediol utilization
VFSVPFEPRLYNKDQWSNQLTENQQQRNELLRVVRQSPASKDVNMEAEKSTLLGAVTQKRLVKTNWKHLGCAAVRSQAREL